MYDYSPYIRQNLPFLRQIASTKSQRKSKTLILNATAEQILAIVEIIANILHFNFVLTPRQKQRLAKYADLYRSIARARTEKGARQRIQSGSGFPIAAILLPVITTLAQHFIEKAIK